MFSKLDAIVVAAWLFTGSLMVESHHRVDLIASDTGLKRAKVATRCQAAPAKLSNTVSLVTSPALAGDAAAAFVQLPKPGCPEP